MSLFTIAICGAPALLLEDLFEWLSLNDFFGWGLVFIGVLFPLSKLPLVTFLEEDFRGGNCSGSSNGNIVVVTLSLTSVEAESFEEDEDEDEENPENDEEASWDEDEDQENVDE